MPKPTRTTPEDINQVSVQIPRSNREPEPIDLAAEATQDSTPSKSLYPKNKQERLVRATTANSVTKAKQR